MNVQHLRYLVAFSEHRTLTDAAASLGITQPAISRALHELEQELGCVLFRRAGRRLEFTAAGHDVLGAARRALAAIDDINRVSDVHAARPILRIATLGAIAAGMSPILERFLRKAPDTHVQIQHLGRDEDMLDMVRGRDVDVAYGAVAKTLRGLTFTPSRPLGIVLASPIGTDLPAAVTFEMLDKVPMICPWPNEERRRLLDEPFARAGAKLNCVIESGDPTTFLSGIRAGIGSSAIWDVNAEREIGVELRQFDPPREIAVGFIHHPKPAAIVRTLLDISRKLERERARPD